MDVEEPYDAPEFDSKEFCDEFEEFKRDLESISPEQVDEVASKVGCTPEMLLQMQMRARNTDAAEHQKKILSVSRAFKKNSCVRESIKRHAEYLRRLTTMGEKRANERCVVCFEYGTQTATSRGPRPLQACATCRRTFYCGRHCQKVHWPDHRERCQRLAVERLREQRIKAAARGDAAFVDEKMERLLSALAYLRIRVYQDAAVDCKDAIEPPLDARRFRASLMPGGRVLERLETPDFAGHSPAVDRTVVCELRALARHVAAADARQAEWATNDEFERQFREMAREIAARQPP